MYNTVIPFEVSAEITRPSDTTAYAIGDLMNGNGLSALPALDFGAIGALPGQDIQIVSASILSSNGAVTTKLQSQVHLFKTATLTGSTLTDNTALSVSYAQSKANHAAWLDDVSNTVSSGSCYRIMQAEVSRLCRLPAASAKLYAAIIANNAYVPASGETLTLTLKGYLLFC